MEVVAKPVEGYDEGMQDEFEKQIVTCKRNLMLKVRVCICITLFNYNRFYSDRQRGLVLHLFEYFSRSWCCLIACFNFLYYVYTFSVLNIFNCIQTTQTVFKRKIKSRLNLLFYFIPATKVKLFLRSTRIIDLGKRASKLQTFNNVYFFFYKRI